jgi:hypothetical protein
MTLDITGLAARIRRGEGSGLTLSDELVATVKAARSCEALRANAETIMAHFPVAFPLFGARQAD